MKVRCVETGSHDAELNMPGIGCVITEEMYAEGGPVNPGRESLIVSPGSMAILGANEN